MTTICKNCNNDFNGHFCNICGQPAETHEMNFHFLWHDIQHGLFHFDKGIFFTIKELFTRPGYSIKEFIDGMRVKHFKPISLVILLAGIYGFLYHYFHINILANAVEISGTGKDIVAAKEAFEKVNDWVAGHYAIVSLIQLPIYALGTFIAFKKGGYNFVQHLVLNAFLTVQKLILHIVAFPLLYNFSGTPALKKIVAGISILGFVLMTWTLIQFFDRQKQLAIFWRTILSVLIYFVLLGFLGLLCSFIYFKMHQ